MSFTAEELECLQDQLCECEKEYDPSGGYSMVTAECLNCQFIEAIETLLTENKELKTALGRIIKHSGYGGWDLQDAYAYAHKVMDRVQVGQK